MISGSLALKVAGIGCGGLSVFFIAWSIAANRQSMPYRYWAMYITYLERKLRNLLITDVRGEFIARLQSMGFVLVVAIALYFGKPELYLGLLAVVAAPAVYLERKRTARLRMIEAKMDGFILTLANALKSTPSIGNALAYAQPLLPYPLDAEVGLALKEIRVGNTVDQALMNMSARIRSMQLDATLSGILIGRQVGGDLTQILETTAGTLREIARLQGVVKAKTAEGKGQLIVLAVFPAVIVVLFDTVSPGYFEPLTRSPTGYLVIAAAVMMWASAIVVARKVLAVDV